MGGINLTFITLETRHVFETLHKSESSNFEGHLHLFWRSRASPRQRFCQQLPCYVSLSWPESPHRNVESSNIQDPVLGVVIFRGV